MTNEEAIVIEHEITRMLVATVKEEHKERVFTAHKMAIEALEKQIPKKPKVEHFSNLIRLEQIYVCPTCGDSFNMNEYEMDYCWECGQRLDWREVE